MTEEASPKEKPRMKDIPRDLEPYFIGFLMKGERWNDTQGAEAAELMPRHLAFMREQVRSRALSAGGADYRRWAGCRHFDHCRQNLFGGVSHCGSRPWGAGRTTEGGGTPCLSAVVERPEDQLFLVSRLRRSAAAMASR